MLNDYSILNKTQETNLSLLPPLDKLKIPVIGSPLFIISNPDLVIAQCKAGVIGSFPALNARPQHVLEEWIVRIKTELAEYQEQNPEAKVAPFAVNQICHGSNDRLMDDMATCVKHEVPIIITSLRPPAELVEAAHSYGGLVFHDVINVRHAKKAAEQGVDGLILVAAGAGGHGGTLHPMALINEIKTFLRLNCFKLQGPKLMTKSPISLKFACVNFKYSNLPNNCVGPFNRVSR